MAQTDNPSPASGSAISTGPRLLWIVLLFATLFFCYFHNLGILGLTGPDEPRYAWIARSMTETGDWITPRLYGKPWFEKPVLYYWSAALSFKIFGVNETAARLPSAIFALLATLAMGGDKLRIHVPGVIKPRRRSDAGRRRRGPLAVARKLLGISCRPTTGEFDPMYGRASQ